MLRLVLSALLISSLGVACEHSASKPTERPPGNEAQPQTRPPATQPTPVPTPPPAGARAPTETGPMNGSATGALPALDAGQAAGCRSDADCEKGQVCEACGRDKPPQCVGGCRTDEQCAEGERCVQVECIRCPCPALCQAS